MVLDFEKVAVIYFFVFELILHKVFEEEIVMLPVSILHIKSVNSIEVLKVLNFELKVRIVVLMVMMELKCVMGSLMMGKTKEPEVHKYPFLIIFEE